MVRFWKLCIVLISFASAESFFHGPIAEKVLRAPTIPYQVQLPSPAADVFCDESDAINLPFGDGF